LTLTHTDLQAPSRTWIILMVTDTNTSAASFLFLSAPTSFAVILSLHDALPILGVPATNVIFTELQTNLLSISVSDSDVPTNTFNIEVAYITAPNTGLPLETTNITVTTSGPTNALLSWFPSEAQGGPDSYRVTVQ